MAKLLKELFPKMDIPVKIRPLDYLALYVYDKDFILLDKDFVYNRPELYQVVLLHEMIHATGHNKRLGRANRLILKYLDGSPNGIAYKIEECIAELCCMVATYKLGLFNGVSFTFINKGLIEFYDDSFEISKGEMRKALGFFACEGVSFEKEIEYVIDHYDWIKFIE